MNKMNKNMNEKRKDEIALAFLKYWLDRKEKSQKERRPKYVDVL